MNSGSRHEAARRGASRALLGALVLVPCACSSTGAQVFNLEQLHSDDGHHHFSAVQMGDFEWEFRDGMRTLLPTSAVAVQEKKPSKIDDPLETCLATLVDLRGITSDDPYEASIRLQAFARWAVEDPWKLSRERCVLALQHEAHRLRLEQHLPRPFRGDPVGPEELADALAQLTASLRPTLQDGVRLDRSTLEAACARLSGYDYDLNGARRAAGFVALLERRAPRKLEELEPLRALHLDLQRVTLDRALTAALEDRSPFERSGSHPGWGSSRVRATALLIYVRSYGAGSLGQFLAKLLTPREDPDVLIALLRAVREVGGLPLEQSQVPVAERATWESRWIDSIVALAAAHPDGRVRIAAMRTLGVISGGALESLREEDWLAWRQAHKAATGGDAPDDERGDGSGAP